MKRTEVLEITERSLTELNESLKTGASGPLTEYLKAVSVFRNYSYRNIFLILAQNPNATQVAGFHAWKQLGRWVKQGEEGIGVIAPMMIRPKLETDDSRDLVFRVVHVFDVSQTDGEPLPTISEAKGDPLDIRSDFRYSVWH